ncbi:MAG: integrase DNA-binding domain-containing protein [Oscillospiraceae bacterium]|nr:integrase DNA-binding domain-containing protein [Oscillospiraceae bacterium]
MAERRKDNKGRVLRTGESQRKDLLYQFRYTDGSGKRRTVYANNLPELREKERKVEIRKKEGVDFSAGNVTVLELATRYIELKQNIRVQTLCGYRSTITALKNSKLGYMHICDVKQSDVKSWYVELRKSGKSYSTVAGYKTVLMPAFKMAYDEYAVSRNPFDFPLKAVIKNDSEKRSALTKEQQMMWLEFIHNDSCYKKHYDEFVVLLETGLRISELCGLIFEEVNIQCKCNSQKDEKE